MANAGMPLLLDASLPGLPRPHTHGAVWPRLMLHDGWGLTVPCLRVGRRLDDWPLLRLRERLAEAWLALRERGRAWPEGHCMKVGSGGGGSGWRRRAWFLPILAVRLVGPARRRGAVSVAEVRLHQGEAKPHGIHLG